jgi:hypothetical protein
MMERNFDKVFRQGSGISGGAIDNSSQGLAYVHEHGGASGRYGHAGLKAGRFRTTATLAVTESLVTTASKVSKCRAGAKAVAASMTAGPRFDKTS